MVHCARVCLVDGDEEKQKTNLNVRETTAAAVATVRCPITAVVTESTIFFCGVSWRG